MAFEYTPEMLAQIGKLPLMFTNQGLNMADQAKQRDVGALQEMMMERQRKQQEFEALQAQRGATLQSTMLANDATRMTNEKTAALNPYEVKNKIMKYGIEADEEDFNKMVRTIQKNLMSDDPTRRKQAETAYELIPSVREARLKAAAEAKEKQAERDKDIKVEGMRGQTSRDVATIGADARRQSDLARLQAASSSGMSLDKLISEYIQKGAAATTEEEKQYYQQLLEVAVKAKAQTTAAGQQPILNPGQVGQGGIPLETPTIPPVPSRGGQQNTGKVQVGTSRGKPVYVGDVLVKDGKRYEVQANGELKEVK